MKSMLARYWGIEGATLVPATGGFTNTTWLVDAPDGRFAVRRSWTGKPLARAEAEERVLAAAGRTSLVPRVMPTRDGAAHVRDEEVTVHLMTRVDGDRGPRWLAPTDGAHAVAAMTALAQLHATLATLAVDDVDPWSHLRARLARVRAGRLDGLPAGTNTVLDAAARALDAPAPGPVQWLHGDFHLGNLLWRGPACGGIVDFDDVGIGAVGGEVALALFALARRESDDRFAYDEALWRIGRDAYEAVAGPVGELDEPSLARVFCASQVLVHLEAAQRALWALDRGIGFWPCWRALI